jgi:hypothetical protein
LTHVYLARGPQGGVPDGQLGASGTHDRLPAVLDLTTPPLPRRKQLASHQPAAQPLRTDDQKAGRWPPHGQRVRAAGPGTHRHSRSCKRSSRALLGAHSDRPTGADARAPGMTRRGRAPAQTPPGVVHKKPTCERGADDTSQHRRSTARLGRPSARVSTASPRSVDGAVVDSGQRAGEAARARGDSPPARDTPPGAAPPANSGACAPGVCAQGLPRRLAQPARAAPRGALLSAHC